MASSYYNIINSLDTLRLGRGFLKADSGSLTLKVWTLYPGKVIIIIISIRLWPSADGSWSKGHQWLVTLQEPPSDCDNICSVSFSSCHIPCPGNPGFGYRTLCPSRIHCCGGITEQTGGKRRT